jgi:hypothetical protein
MRNKNDNKKSKKFNNIKKNIKEFMKDEEGFVSKDNILKVGLGTISALGIIGSLSTSFAGQHSNHTSHNESNYLIQDWIPGTNCYKIGAEHTNHPSHVNHSSY